MLRGASRYSRWRALSLTAVYVLIGLHIAHWKISGRTVAPLELNEVLHTLHLGIVTVGFLFMVAAVVGTCVAGRFFCSWGCHMLAVEDLCAWLLGKIGVRPKLMRSRVLLWVPPLAMAYLFLWPQVERLHRGDSQPALRVATEEEGWASFATTDMWRNLPGLWIAVLTFGVCGFAIVYFLGSRSFCRYVCPFGAVFAAADRLAPGRIVAGGDCRKCGRCTAVCPSHVPVREEVAVHGAVVSSSCLRDLNCVGVCPHKALRFGFTRPPLLRSWAALLRPKRRHGTTWRDEALVGLTFLATLVLFRGLYDAVPFLLALGIAALFAFFASLGLRLVRGANVRLSNLQLRASGRLTSAGWACATICLLLALFAAHSASIRYHCFLGERAFGEMASRRQGAPRDALPSSAAKAAADALRHLETAYRWGLVRPSSLRHRLASLHLLSGSPGAAEDHLRAILEHDPGDRVARLRLGRLLARLGRTEAAIRALQEVTDATETLRSDRDRALRGAAWAALADMAAKGGSRSEAIRRYERAVLDDPGNPEWRLALGALLAAAGRLDEAETHLLESARLRPTAAVHNNLGVVLARMEKDTEAIRHYRASLRLAPDNARAHHNMGLLLHKRGELEEASKAFEAAIGLNPAYSSAHDGLARVLRDRGNLEQARSHSRRAAEISPLETPENSVRREAVVPR